VDSVATPDSMDPRLLNGTPFSDDELSRGAVMLYAMGTIYTFLGLAIVCDEFFVPTLEVISSRLHLSNDVAGATFMAAGGSAPEFFTSLMGTFKGDASVGISTIVGSAVFNVLLVIGACAFAAPEPLQLTWFPLARDASFYAVDLVVLALFFIDEKIQVWESLLLFMLYVAYVSFMVPSPQIEAWALAKTAETDGEPPVQKQVSKRPSHAFLVSHEMNGLRRGSTAGLPHSNQTDRNHERTGALHVHPLIKDAQATAPPPPVEGTTSPCSPNDSLVTNNSTPRKSKKTAKSKSAPKGKGKAKAISKGASSSSKSPRKGGRAGSDPPRSATAPAIIGQSFDGENPSRQVSGQRVLQPEAHHSALPPHQSQNPNSDVEEGVRGPESTVGDDDEDGGEPLELKCPDSDVPLHEKVMWAVQLPIFVVLSFTIPDVRREGREPFFVVAFIMSIVWIGIFTYFMVDWVTVVAETLRIPVTVLALTLVAGGTSVPDMLTSVIVARKGKGDMAVSSSIGSNIFDVTCGMPVPWMLYMIIRGEAFVEVGAQGLLLSVSLLLGMLLVTVLSIMYFGWIMGRELGVALVCMYFLFLGICLWQMWE